MPSNQCPTCGAKMIPAYTHQGLEAQICPNITNLKNIRRIGVLRTAQIPCSNPNCPNCGAEQYMAVTKAGLRLQICGNLKNINAIKRISGVIKYLEIPCQTQNITGLEASFKRLTENTNITLEALRKVTHETVDTADLYENTNLAIMLGLPKDQLVEFFGYAYILSMALGLEPSNGVQALCKGVGRRSRLWLDNIGITFKPSDAYGWYKSQKRLDTLITDQKTEAWQRYAMHQIRQKAEQLQLRRQHGT